MKFLASLPLLVSIATAKNGNVRRTNHSDQQQQKRLLQTIPDPTDNMPPNFVIGKELETPTCDKDTDLLCYEQQKDEIAKKLEEQASINDGRRKLDSTFIDYQYPNQYKGSAADFTGVCYALPDDWEEQGWTRLDPGDDVSVKVELPWAFSFYDKIYEKGHSVYISTNGIISFEGPMLWQKNGNVGYNPYHFPSPEIIIAPYWSDVDTRPSVAGGAPHGAIYYRFSPTENTLSVIWDRVGYHSTKGNRRNTFQAVISDSTYAAMGDGPFGYNNICFCYGDMEWSTGSASGGINGFGGDSGTPAIVGINGGSFDDDAIRNGFFSSFAPYEVFGQFGVGNSMEYDGPGMTNDGIDFLDFRGTTFQREGTPKQVEPICFDAHKNLPPLCTGFPVGGTISAVCKQELSLLLSFATPELDQTISATYSGDLPQGMTITKTVFPTAVSFLIKYTPQGGDGGIYDLVFTAQDDFVVPSTLSKNLTIQVPTCAEEEYCIPVTPDDSCDPFDPRPFCTPFRSPEHCPADKSFPTLIRTRNDVVEDDPAMIEEEGFWFHYLKDKVAGYVFTTSEGFNAPNVLCCVNDVSDLDSMCFDEEPTGGFVIRVDGHHSGKGIFVLPNGFGNMELLSGMTKTKATILTELAALSPPPNKILVEEFVPGLNDEMPVEYKFHMFGDKIGAITGIYNKGTDCGCYAEFDENGDRLDKYGCFEPAFPEKKEGDCYAIDFDAGSQNPFQMKGMDICSDPLPPIPTCVFDDLVSAAKTLGAKIGVYVRIDFFVDKNGIVYVQEYTFNHNGGLRHCMAKRDESGCIDSCFMATNWNDNGGNSVFGGPKTSEPDSIEDWTEKSLESQCSAALVAKPPTPPMGSC